MSEESALCNALVKELDLTKQVLTTEFTYARSEIDLNADGKKEVIAWIPNKDLGGTSGYPIVVFSKTVNEFEILLHEQAWTPVIALNSTTNGWRDVAFQVAGGGVEPHFQILKHNGRSFISAKTQTNQPNGKVIIKKDWK